MQGHGWQTLEVAHRRPQLPGLQASAGNPGELVLPSDGLRSSVRTRDFIVCACIRAASMHAARVSAHTRLTSVLSCSSRTGAAPGPRARTCVGDVPPGAPSPGLHCSLRPRAAGLSLPLPRQVQPSRSAGAQVSKIGAVAWLAFEFCHQRALQGCLIALSIYTGM